MITEQTWFQWPDYVVLAIVLVASAAIGFYFAFTGGRQQTTEEYLFADKTVHWLPISCSLLASFISAITILSAPGEIYSFGTIFLCFQLSTPIGILIASSSILPVFHNLKVVSIYKYVELRYGKHVKMVVSVSGVFAQLFTNGIAIYGPSLSIAVVTGMDLWVAVALTTGVGLLYTVMGGMKAVIWSDTLQLVIMFVGIIGVFIMGTIKEGGPSAVYRDAKLSGRLDIFEPHKLFDFDPRARHTLWNLGINGILVSINAYGTNQISVMRTLSLKNTSQILRTYMMTALLSMIFGYCCMFMGLVIFSHNKYCDPIKNGEIFSRDQYYPLYVMKLLGHLPGLPGFVLSALFSGSLSTISSKVNAVATVVMADFVKPFRPEMTDRYATIVTKILSVAFGLLSVVFVIIAKNFGNTLITMMVLILGILGGPSFAVFGTGIFLPFVNRRGIIVGFILGAAYGCLIGLGGLFSSPFVYAYPVSTVGCNITNTSQIPDSSFPYYDPSTWNPQSHYRKGFQSLFDISYAWSNLGGIIITVISSVLASLLFGCKEKEKVNYRLISPVVANSKYLPQSWNNYIDYSEDDAIMAHHRSYITSTTDKHDPEPESECGSEKIEGIINEGMSMEKIDTTCNY